MRSYTSLELLFVVSGVLFVSSNAFATNEVWTLTTFKEAIYEDPHLVLSNWDALDADPCDWTGVACSVDRDHVIKINISGSSLKGFLAPELGLLTYLQELILHGNNLIGIIPKELGLLKNLKVLDLGMNQITGPIPPEIGNLTNLVKINLQSNRLTGRLPPELGNLNDLQELHLDRNKLQGTVPPEAMQIIQLTYTECELFTNTAVGDFTPHVVTINTGEISHYYIQDVAGKILSLSQKGPRGICILSANGAVSNVTIHQPGSSGGILTYEGRIEILSLSGSFTVTDTGGVRSRTGGLSVSLADSLKSRYKIMDVFF